MKLDAAFNKLIFPAPIGDSTLAGRTGSPILEPLATSLIQQSIGPQSKSLLFSLPRELRDCIWTYVLRAYSDDRKPYPTKHRYWRPWRYGTPRIAYELLMTCRAIYAETWDLPLRLNPIAVLDGDRYDRPPVPHIHKQDKYNKRLTSWQYALVQGLDITLQQIRLESNCISEWSKNLAAGDRLPNSCAYVVSGERSNHEADCDLCISPNPIYPMPITNLTIRMGRTDWWSWSEPLIGGTGALALDPLLGYKEWYRGNQTVMARSAATLSQSAEAPDYPLDSWARSIARFPDLTELRFVLETFHVKRDQLERVVDAAKMWRFPHKDEKSALVWDGQVRDLSWRYEGDLKHMATTSFLRGQNEELVRRVEAREIRWIRKEYKSD